MSVPEGSLSCGVSIQGHLCPGGLCPGGSLSLGVSRGSLSWGSLSREVCVQGGLCQGDHPHTVKSGGMHPTGMYSSYARNLQECVKH